MNIAANKMGHTVVCLFTLLLLTGLACAQAGEILTPAEATERAQQGPGVDGSSDVAGDFEIGETATLTGRSFLVNLLNEPGGRIVAGQERGARVTVENVAELDGELWYRVSAGTGSGWVHAENLEPVGGEEAEGEEGTAEGEEAQPGAIRVGDTVYLTGVGFLINLYSEPGGRISATQERGAAVTVLAAAEQDGVIWYQINAPTGQGWTPEGNITTEAP